jgi:NADPH:quinone reductase-like Zn-dependent oxidoreductase
MFVHVSSTSNITRTSDDEPTLFTVMIIFTAYGFEYKPYGLNDDDRRELSAFLQKVSGLVKDGKLKPTPIKKFEGGLEKVFSVGYKYLAEGKASAEKVVFTL